MATKKKAKMKLRPLGNLAEEIRKSAQPGKELPKFAPKKDLMREIKRSEAARKAVQARWAKKKKAGQ